MADNAQNNPKAGKKSATRSYRPTHRTAKLIADFEKAERREGGQAEEYLVELGLAVWLANDHFKYRLPDASSAENVN
jgi:hypothetical protein